MLKVDKPDGPINMFIINEYKKKNFQGVQAAEEKKNRMEEMKENVQNNPAQAQAFRKICDAIDGKS